MIKIEEILTSTHSYQQAFENGLLNILSNKTAGTFILVCANIFQHPKFLTKYKMLLDEVFSDIEISYKQCSIENKLPDDALDDVTVMNKIISLGINNLEPIQNKQLKQNNIIYHLNYNQLRTFRPARMSSLEKTRINTSFNPTGFHFDKEFLKKEIFAEGEINGRTISLLYNKFPFVEYHALLVLDKTKHYNQFLTKEILKYIFKLQNEFTQKIPELVITYNSIGAGASVNHLHFQVFIETKPLAIFSNECPIYCHIFKDINKCWEYIQDLHKANVAYNLLIKNQKVYCLPRKVPVKNILNINTSAYGWSEMAGIFTVNNLTLFNNITISELLETIDSVSERIK